MTSVAERHRLLSNALQSPCTRANRPPQIFLYSKDQVWRAAVTVNK